MIMIDKYYSVTGECVTQKIIEKSKFITTSRHVESEEQAREFITEISKKYSDATHNCHAYIPDITGNFPRFSDDGEPQGTAGMPMLEVLKNKNLVQTAVVVTRYFGGVKLGAGGLVRAYSGYTAENLAVARIAEFQVCAESMLSCDYPLADALLRGITEQGASVVRVEYSDRVNAVVAVKKSEEEKFLNGIINRLNGRLEVNKIREYYFPFEI